MVLLDKLMRQLKKTGHRVLVFSQVGCGGGGGGRQLWFPGVGGGVT